MNIGILSMQRIINYGSFLQAYALKSMLEQRGHQVKFVDIDNKEGYSPEKTSKSNRLLRKLKVCDKYLIKRLMYSKKNKELNTLFQRWQNNYLGLKNIHMNSDNCDAVVIGSDEIFNCSSTSQWGINGQRFGTIKNVDIVLSYAASCGYTNITDIDDNDKDTIINGLLNLKQISVRDSNSCKFVKNLCGIKPEINLDPVLIYDFKKEVLQGEKEGIPDYPYMIVYAYHNRINSEKEIKAIKSYAKSKGLKTIAIGGSLPWCDEFAILTPFQVLAYFKHADCIVTDTFHGTVMSAKFNKPLAVIIRDSNKNKLGDLLKRLEIDNHKLQNPNFLKDIIEEENDYVKCNQIISKERINTSDYFQRGGL